jgi:predicted nucleic acid-binding protein
MKRKKKFLLDTNTLSSLVQKYADYHAIVSSKAASINDDDEIYVSIVSLYEMELGKYKAPQLTIKTQQGEPLAAFKPAGASVLLAEGTIDVEGWLDRGYIVYMLANSPQTFYHTPVDGWYWQEQRLNTDPHFLNKTWLLQLITWVSDYEFKSILKR